MSSYLSISVASEGLYKEKGSRFLAFAYPVDNSDQAKELVRNLRILHPKAVHVCFAWRIGVEQFEERYSDDGEPNNSAGKPIFGQILSAEITNVLIAVVRYYGGTKLGVGGLINAYKTAAKDAIDNNSIIEEHEVVHAVIRFNPANTGQLMSLINKLPVEILSRGFEEQLHILYVALEKEASKEIINTFAASPLYHIEIS